MSKKAIILQVGRLDRNIEQNIKFVYENQNYQYPLSSFALKEYLKKSGIKAEVHLLYPVSLPLNDQFKKNECQQEGYGDFFKILSELVQDNYKIENYLKNPDELFSNHPHTKISDGFLILHSIGNYSGKELKTNLHDIILNIWIYLIDIYLKNGFDEVYIDISSGLNIYITALIEALRYFLVWNGLFNLENKDNVKGYISYTDPIIGRTPGEISIYTYEVTYKYNFTSPVMNQDINCGIAKRVIEDSLSFDREKKKQINELLESFLTLFSCFYNACPLYLFMQSFPEAKNSISLMNIIIEKINLRYKENWLNSPQFDFKDFSKILLSLAFFHGLKKIVECKGYEGKEFAKLEELKDFANILSKLNLQIQESLLKAEIHNNFEHSDFNSNYDEKNPDNKWIYLKDLLKYESYQIQKLNERNFFAHAGFERNITMVKKENNEIMVKYDKARLEEIKNFLIERAK